MNFNLILCVGKSVVSTATMVGNTVIKHSPEILVGAGIAGGVVTTVMASKATLKVSEVCKESNEMYEKIEAIVQSEEITEEQYSEEDARNDRIILASTITKSVLKNYVPVAVVGLGSVACILCGYNILSKRNMAIVAAYSTLQTGFETYRKRVIKELGEEADWRFRTGATQKKIEREVIDESTGEIKTRKIKADVIEEDIDPIDYTINFCREAIHISDRMDITGSLSYIQGVENSANLTLKADKFISLNDVREMLGVPKKSYGQIVGWALDGTGDNYVHLETKVMYDERLGQDTIIIDPNIDGPMFYKIDDAVKELVDNA